jgi:hypothetical protein
VLVLGGEDEVHLRAGWAHGTAWNGMAWHGMGRSYDYEVMYLCYTYTNRCKQFPHWVSSTR